MKEIFLFLITLSALHSCASLDDISKNYCLSVAKPATHDCRVIKKRYEIRQKKKQVSDNLASESERPAEAG